MISLAEQNHHTMNTKAEYREQDRMEMAITSPFHIAITVTSP